MLSLSVLDKDSFGLLQRISLETSLVSSLLSEEVCHSLLANKILVKDNEDDNYVNMLRHYKYSQLYTSNNLSLVVCPTLSCNFACPYCYESSLKAGSMNNEVQDELIRFINRNSEGKKGLTLSWHGGEPLAAFDTIKQLYYKIEAKSELPIVHSSMVSNGYLLTEEICSFLAEHKLDYLQITLDGLRETHDKSRVLKNGKSSYNKIVENIDMALEVMPNCRIGIRTNIGRANREEYETLYRTLSARWKGKNCNIYYAFVLANSLRVSSDERKTIELSTDERNDFEIGLSNLGIKDKKQLFPRLDKSFRTCGDNNAFVVSPQGDLFKCWADVGISNRSIGSLKTGVKNFEIVSQFMLGSDKFSDQKCLLCAFLPICDGGCNLYRVGRVEKGLDYDVCCINERSLVRRLETYLGE